MAVHQQKIGPAVVVKIKKHGAPAKISGTGAKTRGVSYVGKGAIAIIVIERGGVVGEVRAEKIQIPIAIVICNRGAHACLLAAVDVVGHARKNTDVREGSVAIVAVEDTRCAVAGHVDIRPAVVVKIKG